MAHSHNHLIRVALSHIKGFNMTSAQTKPVQLRLKPELHQWVQVEATKLERSANWLINKVLADAKAQREGRGAPQ
jgi:predicted HicB family RNase H-like nuclease